MAESSLGKRIPKFRQSLTFYPVLFSGSRSKAYAAGSLLYNTDKKIASSIDSLTQISWKFTYTDYADKEMPDSVSVGYSYDVAIDIPAKKGL